MTDSQQPPAVPERIWIDPEDSTFWNDTGNVTSLIPYARIHPVDDARVEEIHRWVDRHTMRNSNAYADLSRAFSEIQYLLSLLPQLSSSERRCGECEEE
jgi:hypothetical protein